MITREYQAKLELLDQIDAWLDERTTLVTIQATEDGYEDREDDDE